MQASEKLNSLNIPLIVKGSGEPLIMLHGFLSSKEAFLKQIEYFSKYFTVVAYDLCGFGKNTPMPYPFDLSDYLYEFNKIANCFNGRVNVMGHSFGCRVLLYSMATSDKIKKAVLCGVAGIKPKFSLKKQFKRCAYRILKPYLRQEVLEKRFFSSDYNLLNDIQKQSFKKVVNFYLDGQINKIQVPVLAIFGSEDRETPIKSVGKVLKKQIKECSIVKMQDTGHFCFVQDANQFNLIAKEFLL